MKEYIYIELKSFCLFVIIKARVKLGDKSWDLNKIRMLGRLKRCLSAISNSLLIKACMQ